MVKNITFILALMSAGLLSSVAATPDSISQKNLTLNRFSDNEIADMPHAVCYLDTVNHEKSNLIYYAEGDICPALGEKCKYSAVMKLNGKLTILKQVASTEDTTTYKNEAFTVFTKRTLIHNAAMDDEGSDVKYNLVIKTKNSEVNVDMFGYCGI